MLFPFGVYYASPFTNPPTRTDRDRGAAESEVHKGPQVTKPTSPLTRTDRDSGAAVSGVGVVGRTQTDRLTGAVQDVVSEEEIMLVGYSTGLTADA